MKPLKEFCSQRLLLLLIIGLAFFLRVWGAAFGLPDVLHGDEGEVVNHAVRFGSGDLNPHRFQYGSLFQYILFVLYGLYFIIGYALGQFSSVQNFALDFVANPTAFYLIARVLSAAFGAAAVAVVYRIGLLLKNETVGILSALLLTASIPSAIHAHYATVDTALSFFCTLAMWRCLVLFEDGRTRQYLLAGFCIGLALATKFNGVLFVFALVVSHVLRGEKFCIKEKILCPRMYLGLAAVLVGHFVGFPFFYFNLAEALREATELRAMHASSAFSLPVYFGHLLRYYWGIPLGAVCALGALPSVIAGNRKMMVIFLTAVAGLCFASAHRYIEEKYILYVLPLLAVAGAKCMDDCLRRLKPQAIVLIVILCLVSPLYTIVVWNVQHTQLSASQEAKQWIEENLPINSRILLDGGGRAGIRLQNSPENLMRQYQRALKHGLMKAEYLELKLAAGPPAMYYDLVHIDDSGGFRDDDYRRYRLWQDLEELGHPPHYYRARGFDYIVITDRYFKRMPAGFRLIKAFAKWERAVRIYEVPE